MPGTYFKPGSYNVICDRTGYKMKAESVSKEWTGNTVRNGSWEERHPLDNIRSIQDFQAVDDPNPESTDAFLKPGDVTVDNLDANGAGVTCAVWDDGDTVWIDADWCD
mgnify:CR=1 FL=1